MSEEDRDALKAAFARKIRQQRKAVQVAYESYSALANELETMYRQYDNI